MDYCSMRMHARQSLVALVTHACRGFGSWLRSLLRIPGGHVRKRGYIAHSSLLRASIPEIVLEETYFQSILDSGEILKQGVTS